MTSVRLRPLLIGVSARIYYPGSQGALQGVFTKTLHYLEQSVAHWILTGHAMPVMVPAVTRESLLQRSELNLDDYATALDGLVLQGGNDVAPSSYGEEALHADWAGDPVRDAYEIQLIRAFIDAGKPVFGVCRGFQLLNVMHGGTLLQDIGTQRPQSVEHRQVGRYEDHFHEIAIEPDSHLARLYPGVAGGKTNSIHHQGIKDLAPGFEVEARCTDDGLIEAIRHTGPGYIAAVQWHPEFHDPQDRSQFDDGPMLNDFLGAARRARDAATTTATGTTTAAPAND